MRYSTNKSNYHMREREQHLNLAKGDVTTLVRCLKHLEVKQGGGYTATSSKESRLDYCVQLALEIHGHLVRAWIHEKLRVYHLPPIPNAKVVPIKKNTGRKRPACFVESEEAV